jgi:toxin-antitoxin system PIN domain toxin
VKLVDLNLLLYAIDETSPRHERAHHWVEQTMSGHETVALAWSVLLGFLRVATRPSVFTSPLRPEQALDLVDGWLARPCTTVVAPTQRHAVVLRELIATTGTAGNLTTDAHLAALAIEHGATVCSTDADFRRFSGVVVVDPLADAA